MAFYKVEYYQPGKNKKEIMKANDINHLRKRLAKDAPKYYQITVDSYKGIMKPNALFKYLGRVVYDDVKGELFWTSADGKTYRISKKTGALLDWDKYWRYV